jgi:hypothetical protein
MRRKLNFSEIIIALASACTLPPIKEGYPKGFLGWPFARFADLSRLNASLFACETLKVFLLV